MLYTHGCSWMLSPIFLRLCVRRILAGDARFWGEGVCAAEVLNLNGSNSLCHQRALEAL